MIWITRGIRPFLAVLVLSTNAMAADAGETHGAQWRNVRFETPVAFSAPVEAGLDAVTLASPPDSAPGKAAMEIMMISIASDMRASFGDSDAELMSYVKSTFLGTTKAGEKTVERLFLGRKISGEIITTKIPKASEIEVFLIALASGDSLAIAFRRDPSLPHEQAEAIKDGVARSFVETKAP